HRRLPRAPGGEAGEQIRQHPVTFDVGAHDLRDRRHHDVLPSVAGGRLHEHSAEVDEERRGRHRDHQATSVGVESSTSTGARCAAVPMRWPSASNRWISAASTWQSTSIPAFNPSSENATANIVPPRTDRRTTQAYPVGSTVSTVAGKCHALSERSLVPIPTDSGRIPANAFDGIPASPANPATAAPRSPSSSDTRFIGGLPTKPATNDEAGRR